MPNEARLFLCLLVSYRNTGTKQLKVAELGAITGQIHSLLLIVPRITCTLRCSLEVPPPHSYVRNFVWAGRMRGLVGQGGVRVWNKCSCEELMTEMRLRFEDKTSGRPE